MLVMCDLLRTYGYFLMYPLVSTVVLLFCYSINERFFLEIQISLGDDWIFVSQKWF